MMIERVGIITIFDLNNYGNRLQSYAVNYVLKSLNKEPENIVNLNKGIIRVYLKINLSFLFIGTKKEEAKRGQIFSKFTKMYGNTSYRYTKSRYDFVICGSDQIWNPSWAGTPEMFGNFADKSKRIAYAASFGVSEIPKEKKEYYKKYLSEMKAISVREEAGARIVKELTGRDAEVLVDPTLMLDKNEWRKISKKPRFYDNKKYILTYFLGSVDKKYRQYIDNIAKTKEYEIINLEEENPNEYWNSTGPAEFIWLIEHREVTFTDSFHGSVFSVLMNVPFIVFERNDNQASMSSRIDTLLKTLQIPDRRFNNQTIEQVMNKDYTHIPAILERERNKAIKFLKDAMEIE